MFCIYSSVLTIYVRSVGMGRPTSDDEGGFKTGGRSPTGDMMTLEEFLAEGMEKSSPKTKVSQSAMIADYRNF